MERQAARTILAGIQAGPPVAPPVKVPPDAHDDQPTGTVNVFRREGDYWLVIFEQHTVRVRDLKGMRYLARLLAGPGREYHVLDLVAAESGTVAPGDSSQVAGLGRSALGDAGEMLDARAKMRTVDASPRSTTTSTRRSPSGIPSEPLRLRSNATSSFESSRAPSAWVAAIDGQHLRPNVLEPP